MESILLSVSDVARLLSIGKTKTYELIANGTIPIIRIGRSVRVPVKELDAVISHLERDGGTRSLDGSK